MEQPNTTYRKTRIAPTPSGFLHLGNVLSFALTAAIAKKNDAKIVLRIDDLDQARVNDQYIIEIFETLEFLEIPWDEGPKDAVDFKSKYSQLHRIGLYEEALQQLETRGFVFACLCSRSQLNNPAYTCDCYKKNIPLTTANASWRLDTSNTGMIGIKEYRGRSIKTSLVNELQNFIVKKKDGFAAYQLTSVIDDLYFGVDLIVRGDDLWPSTVAQHVLASALGRKEFADIVFYHHPLLTDSLGDKLSKSAGATSVKYLRESGQNPTAVFQLIGSMLGLYEKVGNWQQLAKIILK